MAKKFNAPKQGQTVDSNLSPLLPKEDGIDISKHISNNMYEYIHLDFDFVITVCDNAKENCPLFPSKAKKFHRNFPDPTKSAETGEEIMEQVRQMIKFR